MASAKIENDPSRLRNDFKSDDAHLLPYDPVQKKRRNNNERGGTEISDVNVNDAQFSAFGTNPGIEKTDVHLHYHKLTDYDKLSKPQQDELHD